MNPNYVNIDGTDIPTPYDHIPSPVNSHITVMFMDMRNSTGQKFEKSLTAWVHEFMKMYRVIDGRLDQCQFPFVLKFDGDGVSVWADSVHAHHLVNLAASILSDFSNLGTARDGQPTGEIDFQVAAGIATGGAFRLRTKYGTIDHLSSVVDRAARLCSAASAQALFVDPLTVNAANMTQVTSPLGEMLHRTPEQYLGEKQSVQLKGIPEPVEYYEILWDKQLHGVRSAVVTELSTTPPAQSVLSQLSSVPPQVVGKNDQCTGVMKVWMADRGYGFVTAPDGEDFHVSSRALLYDEDVQHLKCGSQIVFIPADAAVAGKSRRAVSVVVVGQDAEGRISFIHPEKPFGFIVSTDDRGNDLRFHMVVDAKLRGSLKVGDDVAFQVALDASGSRSRAMKVEKLGEESSSVA